MSTKPEVVDAEDFGVVADGVTDDTEALQAAFDAALATGRGVLLPDRTIRITATIVIGDTAARRP